MSFLIKVITFTLAFFVLAGCDSIPTKPLEPVTSPPEKQFIKYPRPSPASMRKVNMVVVPQATTSGIEQPLVCTDHRGYENLALNLAELIRYIEDLQAMVLLYERDLGLE